MKKHLFFLAFFAITHLTAQVNYPYSSGQAVFVQSPYNSSLYTNYDYNARSGGLNRLPTYTTNQAVFVQRPYYSQQTVTSYPYQDYRNLPSTASRYASPTAFPTTVAPAYPYGTPSAHVVSRYQTTAQSPSYSYPYPISNTTSTMLYPYTSASPTPIYPSTTIQQTSPSYQTGGYNTYTGSSYTYTYPTSYPQQGTVQTAGRPSAIYNDAYPVTTVSQYPYPTTTTAAPETVIQPAPQTRR